MPVGGVPEIVADGETGWLAAAPTVDSLADAIARAAAAGRAERQRRGAAARQTVAQRFSDAHMRDAYEALYRDLSPTPSLEQPARVLAAERELGPGNLPLELRDG